MLKLQLHVINSELTYNLTIMRKSQYCEIRNVYISQFWLTSNYEKKLRNASLYSAILTLKVAVLSLYLGILWKKKL